MTSLSDRETAWIHIFHLILIAGVILYVSILASVPPVSRDALTHHLFVPKLYLQHGGMYEIPHLTFSYYPMTLDLLYLIPLYFNNDILPKFIHFAFALATAALIYRYLRRRINISYAMLGALFFLTIPVIIRLSSTVYVDLGLIFFLFASLLYFFQWIESGFKPKGLLISAVFCGLALGVKYNGLIGLFLLGLFVLLIYARFNRGQKFLSLKSIGWSAAFVVVALLVFSPWMTRNLVWTGNPVYPLYNGFFNSNGDAEKTKTGKGPPSGDRISHIQARHQLYGESAMEIALIPLRVFFQGKDDNPRYFDGAASPFLLFLPVFAFFGIRSASRQEKTEKLTMLFFSILFLLYACAQASIRIRYFSPILPALVILSIFGLYTIQSRVLELVPRLPGFIKKTVIFTIVFAMLGLNASYMAERFSKDRPLAYITGKLTRDQYIQAFRPEYASFQYANNHLSGDDKIFGLYIGNRGYYSDIPVEFHNTMLYQAFSGMDSGKALANKLREKGFTHLLINFPMFNHWVKEYSVSEKIILKQFFGDYTVKEFAKDGYGLLRITQKAISD